MVAGRVRAALGIVGALAASVATGAVGAGPAAAVTTVSYTVPGEYEVTAPPGTTCAVFVVDGAHGGAGNALGGMYNPGGAEVRSRSRRSPPKG